MDVAVSALVPFVSSLYYIGRYFRLDAEEGILSYAEDDETDVDIGTIEINSNWVLEDLPAHHVKEAPSDNGFMVAHIISFLTLFRCQIVFFSSTFYRMAIAPCMLKWATTDDFSLLGLYTTPARQQGVHISGLRSVSKREA